jgi:hypothetical protein
MTAQTSTYRFSWPALSYYESSVCWSRSRAALPEFAQQHYGR